MRDTRTSRHTYRLHTTDGDDIGLVHHHAPNLEAGDLVTTNDGRPWVVTRYVVALPGAVIDRMLEVEAAPPDP